MMRLFIHNAKKQTKRKSKELPQIVTTNIISKKRSYNTTVSLLENLTLKKNSKHRHRYDYADNHTAALSLPISTEQLEQKKDDIHELIDLSQKQIIEHSARRVDLFFYTLIAYYQTDNMPYLGRTELQHGRGRNLDGRNITQACHSSFFPNLTHECNYSMLAGTHFMDSMNSTVELPSIVNTVDDILENTYKCREKSLAIIQEVSQGIIEPVEGLQKFFELMLVIFNSISFDDAAKNKIITLEKQGTFSEKFCEDSKTINKIYIESLLRLPPSQKRENNRQLHKREKLYRTKINEIKDEILTTSNNRMKNS